MQTQTKIIIIFFSILLFAFISENINYNNSILLSDTIEPFKNQILIKPATGIGSFDPRETTFSVLTYDSDYSQDNKYKEKKRILIRQPSQIKDIREPSYVQFVDKEDKDFSGIGGVDIREILGKIQSLDEKMNMLIINNDPNTCNHEESRDFTINYNDELNSDSSDEDIKDFIISSLERDYPGTFSLSEGDNNNLTDEMKKELIIILENSSSSIRFKFCCQEENCLR
jgi:hypothetical protein